MVKRTYTKNVCTILILSLISSFLLFNVAEVAAEGIEEEQTVQQILYISPTGDDNHPGTEEEPLASIPRAKEIIREINTDMTGDIIVYLREGTYVLDEAVVFDERDSGQNGFNVIYQAYPGEKPVISGGQSITEWELHDQDKQIYKANVGDLQTRQLYVNGERATRARGEGALLSDVTTNDTGHTTSYTDISKWENIQDVEFVYQVIWTQPRNLVESVEVVSGEAQITMQQPSWHYNRNKGMTSTNEGPVWIENAYELLDEPGEWYLDRTNGDMYYIPHPDEDMAKAEVVAPVLEQLLALEGSLDNPVKNLSIEGLTFSFAGWLQASYSENESDYGGHPDIQANFLRLCEPGMDLEICPQVVNSGHITVKHAENITFKENTFTKLGQAGLDIMAGSNQIDIIGNHFYDLSGSGIQIGEVDWADGSYEFDGGPNHTNQPYNTEHYNPEDERKIIRDVRVTNNYIHDIGVEYASAVGIFAGFPQNLLIEHNEISDVPYSGISVGWGWGRQEPNVAQNNQILNNYIHHSMTVLHDGAPIYTLGVQPDSAIRGNYIVDAGQSYGSIYPDEWTHYYTITENVIDEPGLPCCTPIKHTIIRSLIIL